MFRFRRYRVLLICAFVITVLLYQVSKNSQWDHRQQLSYDKTGSRTGAKPKPKPPPPAPPKSEPEQQGDRPGQKSPPPVHHDHGQSVINEEPTVKIPQLKTADGVEGHYGLPTKAPEPPDAHGEDDVAVGKTKPTKTAANVPDRKPPSHHDSHNDGIGGVRLGDQGDSVPSSTTVHWQKPSEWFPVPEESLIMLPTGKPKPVPSVQATFGKESPEAKEKRELRLAKVKAEAQRAWFGYKTYAWTHDELMPVSKSSKDPFCGWAATLVDSLDTLWIMGLKTEFDDAVEAVKDIDFSTTPYRADIPVFETIIRYLGGLVAAYDVTGAHDGHYPVLLEKAVELAEILMSVFDTPNRMPILYYNWQPAYSTNPKRASRDVSVAELGSMGMEFTRLAQLTGKNKYYDAIARITDALEDLQNRENGTAIPGIFPEHLDASGCNLTALPPLSVEDDGGVTEKRASGDAHASPTPRGYESNSNIADDTDSDLKFGIVLGTEMSAEDNATSRSSLEKRDGPPTTAPESFIVRGGLPPNWDCPPQGLTGGSWGMGSYSMGGSQDSAYEYFPKQYLLLGGLEPKYRTMHEKVADAVKEYLLYRPMAKDDPDILFSAKAYSPDGTADRLSYDWEVTHLTCFIGGMFGLGGKIFERPEDVEVAKKLADGCVWAYDVMPTGIMPESATLMPCENPDDCHWNQTAWYERLDPNPSHRESEMEDYYVRKAEWKKQVEELKQKAALRKQTEERERREEAEREKRPLNNTPTRERTASRPNPDPQGSFDDLKEKNTASRSEFRKRAYLDELDNLDTTTTSSRDVTPKSTEEKIKKLHDNLDLNSNTASEHDAAGEGWDQKPIGDLWLPPEPVKPLTHQEYIQQRLEREHIPPGFVALNDKRYILRPEAIESVWYMYRITGDASWQEKGWRMFEAVIKATQTEDGHSAIHDVSSTEKPVKDDSMESFWLAETLKYFYLLFTTPDVISLDEWVLNTEAHPFRRPT
ncbi:Glycosyl hydrolase family 47-domain-containing protein [Madurella fahalii]|uniref:alpha-1,2-Mannosidase n=1 Tax=Madurella fahalii TaxID=1157608 RepID=A0ABQ0GIC5_9PEZI